MYEPAARNTGTHSGHAGELLPIWHLDPGRALFVGPLGHNAPHAHSIPVYLAGLYAPFRLRITNGTWQSCRTAVIPAGLPYEFDVEGQPLAVLYLEPREAGAGALIPLVRAAREEAGALVGADGELTLIRDLYEARDGALWVDAALDSLLAYAKPRARRPLDPRVARAVASLASGLEDQVRVADAARAVGLSPSRFQHLFAREVGVPYRRFRVWQRLRCAIGSIAAGDSFTDAAHRAGFFDQAHFARAFRHTFGAPASPSLRKVRRA
ncbi:AraC family transcriptional regulator [Hyphomicrobium sp.]|uniref:helix-turn-helix transcriptional regulator n=1 Tax=Hyphomicrobium sp. TaxID=82 RepID=UPI0025C73547|nr:AraC family transcriptional regulator [Hyphomicrobium sp.]